MGFTLWNLLKAALLVCNAFAVLHEKRLLKTCTCQRTASPPVCGERERGTSHCAAPLPQHCRRTRLHRKRRGGRRQAPARELVHSGALHAMYVMSRCACGKWEHQCGCGR